MTTLGEQAMCLAGAMADLADEQVADESVVMTAALLLVARRLSAQAPSGVVASALAVAAARQLGMLIAIEMHKNSLGV